ncbi:MAG: hypothetical protein WCP19_08525 [Chloroflexota bacterium]
MKHPNVNKVDVPRYQPGIPALMQVKSWNASLTKYCLLCDAVYIEGKRFNASQEIF